MFCRSLFLFCLHLPLYVSLYGFPLPLWYLQSLMGPFNDNHKEINNFGIVLSVFLQYTDSDYPFGIFKLFLCKSGSIALQRLRGYPTLQGDNSSKSVERFDHMIFVCRFEASRWSKPQREKLLCG